MYKQQYLHNNFNMTTYLLGRVNENGSFTQYGKNIYLNNIFMNKDS